MQTLTAPPLPDAPPAPDRSLADLPVHVGRAMHTLTAPPLPDAPPAPDRSLADLPVHVGRAMHTLTAPPLPDAPPAPDRSLADLPVHVGRAMHTLTAPPLPDAPPAPDRSLADLVEQVALGGGEAFRELYKRTSWRVFGLSNSIIRDVGHAEEVTQEVFLEIWQHAARFDRSRGSASGFVLRLTHSRSVDRVRHTNNSRVRDGTYVRQQFRPDTDCVIEDVVRHDEVRQLHVAVAGLTALQREAITLTFLVGHTNRAASDLLGIPLSTLKTRVRDGVRALRCASPELVT